MSELKSYNYKLISTCIIFVFISFIASFVLNEDSLGGAFKDSKVLEKYFFDFANNFKLTISEFGMNNEVRNSPVFYIIISQLVKIGFEIKYLKYLNIIFVFSIIFFFLKSLEINYKNIKFDTKIFLLCTIALSPTIRSLTINPYPLLWGITFFSISIYYFLKFQKVDIKEYKLKNAFFCIINLSIASYITPNFSVFFLFFWIKFFNEYRFSLKILAITLFSLLLSLPALIFLIWKNFYIFYNSVSMEISFIEKFNFSNKIVIISSIIFLFILPIIKKIKIEDIFIDLFQKRNSVLIFVFIVSIYFFDFKSGAGGGIFYHLSNLILDNNIFLFFIFLISIFIFELIKIYNLNNILIFMILILYNLQYTIYYKYFDPILLFVLLFLFRFNKNKIYEINRIGKRYFIFYILFLVANLFKTNLKFF